MRRNGTQSVWHQALQFLPSLWRPGWTSGSMTIVFFVESTFQSLEFSAVRELKEMIWIKTVLYPLSLKAGKLQIFVLFWLEGRGRLNP